MRSPLHRLVAAPGLVGREIPDVIAREKYNVHILKLVAYLLLESKLDKCREIIHAQGDVTRLVFARGAAVSWADEDLIDPRLVKASKDGYRQFPEMQATADILL